MSVYIDTSVWFAAANIRDKENARAKVLLKEARSRLTSLTMQLPRACGPVSGGARPML